MAESEAAKAQRRAYWTRICKAEFSYVVNGAEALNKELDDCFPLFYDDSMSQESVDKLTSKLKVLEGILKEMTSRTEKVRYHLAEHARAGKLDETT